MNQMQQFVLFQTGNMQFALERNCIRDILPVPETLLQARDRIQQHTIELKRRLLLLIDLAAASAQDSAPVHSSTGKIIVLTGSPPVGLLADNVMPAIDAGEDQLDELPSIFAGPSQACFPKVLRLEEEVALVIDTAALAEFEKCAAVPATGRSARQKLAAQNRKTSFVVDDVQLNTPPQRIDTRSIEVIIAEQLESVISLRVQEAVAHALRRYIGRLGQMG
jgi:chemotaxis signal transduction protein